MYIKTGNPVCLFTCL